MTLGGKAISVIFSTTSVMVRMRTQFYCPFIASFPTVKISHSLHFTRTRCHVTISIVFHLLKKSIPYNWSSINIITSLILFFTAVPVKSELAVEILEKGQVRFWMQAEKLSANAKVNFIFNEKEIFEGPVGFIRFRFLNILLKDV